jgi:hypothetical protein
VLYSLPFSPDVCVAIDTHGYQPPNLHTIMQVRHLEQGSVMTLWCQWLNVQIVMMEDCRAGMLVEYVQEGLPDLT